MKHLLLTFIFFTSITSFAQTFKITEVQTSDDRDYQRTAKTYLNQEVKVTFNDKSITITPTSKNSPLTLKEIGTPANTYYYSNKMGDNFDSYTVLFKKTFGIISSIEMTIYRRTPSYTDTKKLIGKRF